MRSLTIAALIAGAGFVSAQSISIQCQTAVQSILASPDAQCLNPSALVSIFLQNSSTSVIAPVNTWLVGLCARGACSNATLAAVTTNVTTGCSVELSSLGLGTDDPTSLITGIQEAYPVVRQIICLKDTSANQLCPTEILTDIQNSFGTLSITGIETLVGSYIAGNATVPKDATCSDCTKESFNLINQNFPGLIPSGTSNNLSAECGSSFINGSSPSDITETASTSISSPVVRKSGAAPVFSGKAVVAGAASALVLVSSVFVVLA